MIEEQLGGTAAQPEADASTADQSTQSPVGTVAVADEPATPATDAPSISADTAAELTADLPSPESEVALNGSDGAETAIASEPVATHTDVSQDELAHAPAAG